MSYQTLTYGLLAFSCALKMFADLFIDPASLLYINTTKFALIPIFGAFGIMFYIFFKYPENPTTRSFKKKR